MLCSGLNEFKDIISLNKKSSEQHNPHEKDGSPLITIPHGIFDGP